jgi:hypothetical protein
MEKKDEVSIVHDVVYHLLPRGKCYVEFFEENDTNVRAAYEKIQKRSL